MSMEFAIRVVDEHGNAESDVRVTVDYGLLNGQADEFTDSEGWSNFTPSGNYVTATVYIDRESYGEIELEDGATFSFVRE
jgi:hypothetical protein